MDAAQKLEVSELLGRAACAYDMRDLESLAACFAVDARMIIRIADQTTVGPFLGRGAIMDLMRESMETQTDVRRHVISNLFFEEAGDARARVVSYLSLFSTERWQVRMLCTGIYRDVVRRDGTQWVIADRDLYLDSTY